MQVFLNKLYQNNYRLQIFLFYCLITISLTFIVDQYLLTKDFFFNSLLESISKEKIEQLLIIRQKWSWISYILLPLKLIIKITIVSFILKTGFVFINSEIKYSKLVNVALISEIVFIVQSIFLTFFTLNIRNFNELNSIPSFSLFSFFGKDQLPTYLYYPLQNLNVVELIYWLLLAFGLSVIADKKFFQMLKFVLSTYVITYIFWLLLIMLILLNL